MSDSIMACAAVTASQRHSNTLTQGTAQRRPDAHASLRVCAEDVRGDVPLGILTKSPVIVARRGVAQVQRVHDFLLQDQSAKLLPRERVTNCLKKRIDKTKPRFVKYNTQREKAHWANVQRCGSLWICPVCAKPITETRRSELGIGLERWECEHGGGKLLLTLTTSHNVEQPLSGLLSGMQRAYKRFTENLRVRALLDSLGVCHKIRGQEVTYGQNGWHPHFHVLLLTASPVSDFKAVRDELAALWIHCCVRSGLSSPSMLRGLDLRDGAYAAKYVTKWGIEHELTKGHSKKGRSGSYTPFDLLNLSMLDATFDGRTAASLWQEFGIAMKGSKQLVWSRGLKALLRIDEVSDEEAAQQTEQQAIQIAEVDQIAFSLLAKYQHRHTFLECLEHDYQNGCLGKGSAERLLIRLLEYDLEQLPA